MIKTKTAAITDNYTYIRYNLENGPIRKNDFITISSIPGVGMKALASGEILGVAIEDAASAEEDELLKIRVNMQFKL
ncbi:MAG TPA: hypothetical protein DCR04_10610 [Flavobacteriales bacterium]|nr:hypothetical protein [Flavobacteriales bacterium]